MSKSNDLFKKAGVFEKLATAIDSQIINLASAITSEIQGGERALRNMFAKGEKYTGSKALQTLAEQFPELQNAIELVRSDNARTTFVEFKNVLGGMTFFTNPGNAGTGYDPITHEGGAWSPASYLDRIKTHADTIEKMLNATLNATAPKEDHSNNPLLAELPGPGGNQPKRKA